MIRCMIIDSDHASRRTLSRELAKDDTFSVTGMYDYPSEVPFPVNRKTVDVLFIEAVFRGESGLDFVRSLRNPPFVVITTAYRDYAVECFELDILDYLVKPVEQARFSRTLSKIERILSSGHDAVQQGLAGMVSEDDHTFIRADKKRIRLRYAEILYIESVKDYICIHTASAQYIVHQTLSGFTALLPEGKFMRIHRSYTVNLGVIDSVSGSTVHIGEHNLPIGRNYLQSVRRKILGE